VVVSTRRILDEQAIQSVSINDAPQMCVNIRIRVSGVGVGAAAQS